MESVSPRQGKNEFGGTEWKYKEFLSLLPHFGIIKYEVLQRVADESEQ